jgi:hypothetical protein
MGGEDLFGPEGGKGAAGEAAGASAGEGAGGEDDLYRAAMGRASSVSAVAAAAALADAGRYSLKVRAVRSILATWCPACCLYHTRSYCSVALLTSRPSARTTHPQVLDSFPCLGPMRDLLIADIPLGALSSFLDPAIGGPASSSLQQPSACAVAAVGTDRGGALALLRRGVVPAVVTAIPQEKVHGAWALHYDDRPAATATATAGDGAAADGGKKGDAAAAEARHHAFLLLSLEGSHTQVFDARGDTLEDITGKVRAGFLV